MENKLLFEYDAWKKWEIKKTKDVWSKFSAIVGESQINRRKKHCGAT